MSTFTLLAQVDPGTATEAGNAATANGMSMTKMGENLSAAGGESVSAITTSLTDAAVTVIEFGPPILAAVVVMLLGYYLAKYASKAVVALCETIGLQRAAEKSDLVSSMKQAGIERTIPQIFGLVIFWSLIGVFLMAALSVLNLPGVEVAAALVVSYVPRVLVATIMVVVGMLVATLLRGVIATSAEGVGLSYAQQLATGCYYALGVLVFLAAFKHLNIEFEMLNYAILIVLGGAAIGMGLSFGLGGRDVVAGILSGYYLRQRIHTGDQVSVAGMEGTVRDVGAVATTIETDEDGLMHRHSVPNVKMLNEAVR